MSDALSDELFNPLDLDDVLDDAYERGGPEASVELLARALDDPRAAGDPELLGYLDELADQYGDLERYDEAIATAYRIIDLDPEQRTDVLTWIAELHAKSGDLETARTLLHRLRAEYEAAEDWDRDLWHGLSIAVILGDDVGDVADSADWLAADIRTGIRTKVDVDLVKALDTHRRRISALLVPPLVDRPLDLLVEQYAEARERSAGPAAKAPGNRPRNQVRMGYLPPPEFAEARQRGLLAEVTAAVGDTGPADHTAHRRDIELALRQTAPGSLRVVPITVTGLVAYAEKTGLDPAGSYTRLRYAEDLTDPGILWPPERNDPCWCGSGRKYKKCCRTF